MTCWIYPPHFVSIRFEKTTWLMSDIPWYPMISHDIPWYPSIPHSFVLHSFFTCYMTSEAFSVKGLSWWRWTRMMKLSAIWSWRCCGPAETPGSVPMMHGTTPFWDPNAHCRRQSKRCPPDRTDKGTWTGPAQIVLTLGEWYLLELRSFYFYGMCWNNLYTIIYPSQILYIIAGNIWNIQIHLKHSNTFKPSMVCVTSNDIF